MPEILIGFIKEFGIPGAVVLTTLICVWLAARAGATKSSAESEAIATNAKMAHQSQTRAFKQDDLLLAATQRLAELEKRVGQLELEGARKDQRIAELQAELSKVRSTVGELEEKLSAERKKNEQLTGENITMRKQVDILTQQIETLTTRLEQLDTMQVTDPAPEGDQPGPPTPVLSVVIEGTMKTKE